MCGSRPAIKRCEIFVMQLGPAGQQGTLTWQPTFEHVYHTPGNYTLWVEAFNGVGSAFQSLILPVYGEGRGWGVGIVWVIKILRNLNGFFGFSFTLVVCFVLFIVCIMCFYVVFISCYMLTSFCVQVLVSFSSFCYYFVLFCVDVDFILVIVFVSVYFWSHGFLYLPSVSFD